MSLKDLLDSFTQSHALEPCTRDDVGRFLLYVDGDYPLTFYEKGDGIIVLAQIAPLPDGDTERMDMLRRMMKIHFARCRDYPEMLAYDQRRGQLVIYRRLDAQDGENGPFQEMLEQFAASTAYWIEASRSQLSSAAASASAPPLAPLF